jgi:hypothetical protein
VRLRALMAHHSARLITNLPIGMKQEGMFDSKRSFLAACFFEVKNK